MKPPWAYRDARVNAPIHAQIWLASKDTQPKFNGSVRFVGRIVRIFRDDTHGLWTGKRVEFFVPVTGSEGSGEIELNGTIYHHWTWLARTRWFEVFLDQTFDGLVLSECQIAPIRGPTLRPVCDPKAEGFVCEGNLRRDG